MIPAQQVIIPEGVPRMCLHTRSRSHDTVIAHRRSGSALLVITVVLGLGALLIPSVAAQTPATIAAVRVIHASSDTPAVDVYLDGEKTVSALSFTQAKGYLSVLAGTHQVQVFGQGVTPATSAPLINMPAVTIAANAQLSLVVEGLFASMRLSIVDDATTAPAAGKAKLRFVHAGPDVPAVDVAVADGPVLFPNTQYGGVYPYQNIDAKHYDLRVSPTAGTGNAAVTTSINPEAGKTYSVYLMSLGIVQVYPDTAMLPATASGDNTSPAANAAVAPAANTAAPAVNGVGPAATMVAVSTVIPPRATAPVASSAPIATARAPGASSGTTPTAVMLPVTGMPVSDGSGSRLLLFAAVLLVLGGIALRRFGIHRWITVIHRH